MGATWRRALKMGCISAVIWLPAAASAMPAGLYTHRACGIDEVMHCASYGSDAVTSRAFEERLTGTQLWCTAEAGVAVEEAIAQFALWTTRSPDEPDWKARLALYGALVDTYGCRV
jgi:hypothetical protein